MKVLSLFDGMACGMLAMQKAGIEVDRYVAFEIDKYATQTSSHNFPMIEHRGDVFQADFTEFSGFDFLIGGSPCTYWSIAQTKNRETVASGIGWELFSQYVRALHEAKPKYFIYENNKSMSKQIRASIDETFGFEAVPINSALVSAQNRQRLYWVGKRNDDGTYSKVLVEQPEDRGILLRDILETGIAWHEKSFCITATEYKGSNPQQTLTKHRRTMVAEPIEYIDYVPRKNSHIVVNENAIRCAQNKNNASCAESFVEFVDKKSQTLIAGRVNKIIIPAMPVKEATVKGYTEIECGECVDLSMPNSKTRRGRQMDDKSNCMQTSNEFYQYVGYAIEFDNEGRPIKAIGKNGKEITIYEVKNGKITIKGKQYPIKLCDGYYIIRKLTVRECMRLQTVPEWYEFPVSDSQAYKMLGNGWTVDVIAHILKALA